MIPETYASFLRQVMAEQQSRMLQVLFDVPRDEADRRGRKFVRDWERAGCPPLGEEGE